MPKTDVYFFAEADNTAPALEWLWDQDEKVRLRFVDLLERLAVEGSRLKRPAAAPLRDRIYELRVRHLHVNYRLLYFFHGQGIAIVGHGCTKVREVDHADIDRAIQQKARYEANPEAHTYRQAE